MTGCEGVIIFGLSMWIIITVWILLFMKGGK